MKLFVNNFMLIFTILLFIKCSTTTVNSEELIKKADVPLKIQINLSEQSDKISFLILSEEQLTEKQKEKITKTGAVINTIAGNAATCFATKSQIEELATFDFVKRLEKSPSHQSK
jgi:hypothetical protein